MAVPFNHTTSALLQAPNELVLIAATNYTSNLDHCHRQPTATVQLALGCRGSTQQEPLDPNNVLVQHRDASQRRSPLSALIKLQQLISHFPSTSFLSHPLPLYLSLPPTQALPLLGLSSFIRMMAISTSVEMYRFDSTPTYLFFCASMYY